MWIYWLKLYYYLLVKLIEHHQSIIKQKLFTFLNLLTHRQTQLINWKINGIYVVVSIISQKNVRRFFFFLPSLLMITLVISLLRLLFSFSIINFTHDLIYQAFSNLKMLLLMQRLTSWLIKQPRTILSKM